MKNCVWVRPELVAQIEFLEWTDDDHLRHSKFAGLRDDQHPRSVAKEHARIKADWDRLFSSPRNLRLRRFALHVSDWLNCRTSILT
jgi:ATP dependent DNA ligase C terminal region